MESKLKQKVFHNCDKPKVDEPKDEHLFSCECGSVWSWVPMMKLNKVRVPASMRNPWWMFWEAQPTSKYIDAWGGFWHSQTRTSTWVEV